MSIETKSVGGQRHYYRTADPTTTYPSVTSVVDGVAKPFLQRWAAGMAADLALDAPDYIARLAAEDRKEARRYLTGAADRYKRMRGTIGTRVHDVAEIALRSGTVPDVVHPDVRMYLPGLRAFIDAVQPQLVRAEETVWSDTYGYAGRFDAWLRVRLNDDWKPDPDGTPRLLLTDLKTSKSQQNSVALQLSAYAHADKVISADGTESELPAFDDGAILHIGHDGVPTFRRVDMGDEVFQHFLSLLDNYRWGRITSRRVLGDVIWQGEAPA
ncbi:hypothetical protein [Streptomyces albidoflavus]|uniref:hypothetical protein n=1 Tax=Streptomyces albidoflavus TaxID=1886 RepID=UPI00056298A2|nr:hypothetical protein [Streptomyces albidoflavus]